MNLEQGLAIYGLHDEQHKRRPSTAGVPQGDDFAAGAPQEGDITVRYGGGIATKSDVV